MNVASPQADDVADEDPDEEGPPNDHEARLEKYVGVKVKVSKLYLSVCFSCIMLSECDQIDCCAWSRCPSLDKERRSQ